MAEKEKIFTLNDGLPTGPDVNLIMQAWPELKVGDRIDYSDIEILIGVERETNRFRSITVAWRKRMLNEKGLVINCERGAAFYVADANQITAYTHEVFVRIGRASRRQRVKVSTIKDSEYRPVQEHQMRLLLEAEKASKKTSMNVLPNTTVATLPRSIPPISSAVK